MIKSIIKELAIILLLIIAIGLVFAIIFYDYNPVNRVVPAKVQAYVLPAETQEELNETLKESETQELIKTYLVDGSDLEIYESTNDYDKGKVNPFESYSTNDVTEDTENSNNNNNNSNNSQNSNAATPENEDKGQFLNTVGK